MRPMRLLKTGWPVGVTSVDIQHDKTNTALKWSLAKVKFVIQSKANCPDLKVGVGHDRVWDDDCELIAQFKFD